MAETVVDVKTLLEEGAKYYFQIFKQRPTKAGIAPGRVNLIGEHVDYNDGFVLPMALPMVTLVIGAPNGLQSCAVHTTCPSVDDAPGHEFNLNQLKPGKIHWLNYVMGVVANFHGKPIGFNAVILSTVPTGAGLSSSAALEVAMYTFLEAITGDFNKDLKAKALACQKAEHEYAGVPCGIMDQFISVLGKENHAMLLDCRDNEVNQIEFQSKDTVVLITDSGVKHNLGDSEYPKRREECQAAARAIGVNSLRLATVDQLDNPGDKCVGEVMYRRGRHVVKEIIRTSEGAKALASKDFASFGHLMAQSHYSLKDDYEVSCEEIDKLVDVALTCAGVYGSRMTGGGFGGCTVTLVRKQCVDIVMEMLKEVCGKKLKFYIVTPSEGARHCDMTEITI